MERKSGGDVGSPKRCSNGAPDSYAYRNNDLCVENYRGMIEYTDQIIRLQSKSGQIKITGKKLEVIYYTNDEMKIHGHIRTIEYQL